MMPCHSRNLILPILLTLLITAGTVATSQAQGLRINEVQVAGNLTPDSGLEPWVELVNTGTTEIRLKGFALRTDGKSWQLPDEIVAPGEVRVIHSPSAMDANGSLFLDGDVTELALVSTQPDAVVDSVTLPMAAPNESFGRYPNGTGPFRIYSAGDVSHASPNRDIGFVSQLASRTEFRPRDSSPNAIVVHNGQYWILGGWSNFAHDVWYSVADVWRSSDLKHWQLVNESPPYHPYNCFVSWQGRIWALGAESYSSSNGVTWRKEASAPCGRAVAFRNGIVVIAGTTVTMTHDGIHWNTLTTLAPWGPGRVEPFVVVHQGQLWVIGGTSNYGKPDEVLHNDVWSSPDGVTWNLVNANSEWSPRRWATAAVHDDKIFLVGGNNFAFWPEDYGNTSEVWFTRDGTSWMELKSERPWPARHAAYVTAGLQQELVVLAGYGHGGVSRIYNDAWSLRTRIYFSKPTGGIHSLSSWGRNMDGSGARPTSFSADHQLFVLRNRDSFKADRRLSVSGAGSRILVGDGNPSKPVRLELINRTAVKQPLYLYGNSTTVVSGHMPEILYQDDQAKLIVQ